MGESKSLSCKLLELMDRTGYPIIQHNGQRKYGPPLDWVGPPPPKGCEVFIGRLPREIYESELVPVFSKVGKIYEMRMMMDFSGSNRGYGFVTYATRAEAVRAVKELNGYEIIPNRRIGVVKSVDNSRLFIGNLPRTKTREEILTELSNHVSGIVDVILKKNCYDKKLNRGYAFVEFISHRAAAMARRSLVPGYVKLFNQDIVVDWAQPEPDIDDDQMNKVKVLYARNFELGTTPEVIKTIFETASGHAVEKVKKIYDYAFIHFYARDHAEEAIKKLQNVIVDGATIEIRWAKPVDRQLYKIQKLVRGNAKFNRLNLSESLMLYKQRYEKSLACSPKTTRSSRTDEGIGSVCAGSDFGSPSGTEKMDMKPTQTKKDSYMLAPAKLEAMCKRYMWELPKYEFQKFLDQSGMELWVCHLELPQIGLPLTTTTSRIGPLITRACLSMQQSYVEAAELALHYIKVIRADQYHCTSLAPVFTPVLPPVINMPYMYPSQSPTLPTTLPTIHSMWRNI